MHEDDRWKFDDGEQFFDATIDDLPTRVGALLQPRLGWRFRSALAVSAEEVGGRAQRLDAVEAAANVRDGHTGCPPGRSIY
ncbi:hypothetical protein [Sphingomonas sp.]|uniref:hypothetical protein n=1 Tax=Sphingomonas sp. TaxID=28214 RepID=UPI003B00D236